MKILLKITCLLFIFFLAACKHIVKAKPSAKKFNWHTMPELMKVPDSLKYLIPVFDTIICDDQKFREVNNIALLIENKAEQDHLDSQNLVKVEYILSKYGLLSPRKFGFKGYEAITMTLQHAPLNAQEKYLPMITQGFKDEKVSGAFLSMFEDRINAKNKRLQRYGTQLATYKNKQVVFPVINPDSLNIWRKQKGLPTEEYYMKTFFKNDFKLSEYKILLPDLKKYFIEE